MPQMAPKIKIDRAPNGAMKSKYDNSFCTLCKGKIAIGVEITKHDGKWCHDECVKALGSTDTTAAEPKPSAEPMKMPPPAPALIDFINQENLTMLQIEAVITLQHKALGIPFNGQQIGMHTREIYLQAKKTNLVKGSQLP